VKWYYSNEGRRDVLGRGNGELKGEKEVERERNKGKLVGVSSHLNLAK